MVDVEVEYAYEAEQTDELTVKVGDIIKNVTMSEGGWWEGDLNGKRGMFPDNFVKVVPKKEEGKKKDVQASKRQSVKDLANKIKGQVHEGPPILRKKEPGAKKKRAKVIYSYDPENEDELKLEVGEILDVIKQEEEGWWEGINNGKQGMFPSNFVEIVEESSDAPTENVDNKLENTEEHMIKGKKVQGIGLGNIFGDGPIKLRSTGNKKPAERPLEPPKAESRADSAQRKLKELKEGLGIHPLAACPNPRSHKAQDIVERHATFTENIDFIDTDLVYIDDAEKCLEKLSLNDCGKINEDELVEYADVDVTSSDFDCIDESECKPNFSGYDSSSSSDCCRDVDCNNNTLIYEASVGVASSDNAIGNKPNGVADTEYALNESSLDNWRAVLNDLDRCLDGKESGRNNISIEEQYLDAIATQRAVKGVDEPNRNQLNEAEGDTQRMQSLNCWKHTLLTPPEKINFCKAIDSVLVTKHRLIESAEKNNIERTPVHGPYLPDYGQKEHAARSLNYATGDFGATGFVKFAQDLDENGCQVLIARPIDCHNPSVSFVSTSRSASQLLSNTKAEDTYFASQNKSGNLSPFIRSIANRYNLFESSKPHFKQINVGELQLPADEESYAMEFLCHRAENNAVTHQHETSVDENTDLANPVVNQMVNNYVYDVITSENSQAVTDIGQESNVNVKQEDDVSMAVCVDDNSLRVVYSKEDLNDPIQEFEEASTLLNMTGSTDPSPTIIPKRIHSFTLQFQSTPNKQDEVSHLITKAMDNKNKSLPFTPQRHILKRLPVAGIMRQRSSYCRIPFTNDAPSFWFTKDFAESPRHKPEGPNKVRSPKRSSSEISQDVPLLVDVAEQTCLNDFKAKIEAFKKDHSEFSSVYANHSFDHRSPAKKKRKKITCNAMNDLAADDDIVEMNTNSSALTEYNCSNIEAFFPTKFSEQRESYQEDSTLQGNRPSIVCNHKTREVHCKSASSISPRRLVSKKLSVSFASSFPELQDRHKAGNKSIFSKPSKTSAKSPVKLLSYKKWDAEVIPIECTECQTKMNCPKTTRFKSDFFQNFDTYTQKTLNFAYNLGTDDILIGKESRSDSEVCPKNDELPDCGASDICGVETYFKFDDADDVIEISSEMEKNLSKSDDGFDEGNSVSAFFMLDDSPISTEETARVSPIKISKQFLCSASLGIEPDHHEDVRNQVEKAVEEHLKVTNSAAQGCEEFVSMTRTRMNLYNAISAAIESYAPDYEDNDGVPCSRRTEADEKGTDLVGKENSFNDGEVTPDADGLICDLHGLDLSNTPVYANPDEDDNDMRVFLNEAVQTLDDILVDSFNSFSESPMEDASKTEDESLSYESGVNNGEELQDDSVLKVVGKKCVLHETEEMPSSVYGESGEPQDSFEVHDPDFAVIGKKCVLHELQPASESIANDVYDLEKDNLDEAVTKIVDYVFDDISKHSGPYEVKTEIKKAAQPNMKEIISVQKMDVSVRECCSASVDYDEAYDCDGNVIDESSNGERVPSYMCSSPLIPFYSTEGELNMDEVEKSFAANDSPILNAAKDVIESPGVFDQSDGDLDKTRGSSLCEDLEDVGEDLEFVDESGLAVDDCEYVGLEDIQHRMQDSGKWLEETSGASCRGYNGSGGDSSHISDSAMSSNAPPVFEDKVSSFPSPEISGKKC